MTQVSEVFQEILDIQEVQAYRVKGGEGYVAVHSWSCSLLKIFPVEKYLFIFSSINFNEISFRIFLVFFCRVLMVKMVCRVFQVETVNEARLDHLGHLDSQVLRVVQELLDPLAHLDQLESVEKG